jgi:hypothetical protein
MNPRSENLASRMMRRVREWEARDFSRARREHDRVMKDRGIALEHQIQISRALDQGERGCTFCR